MDRTLFYIHHAADGGKLPGVDSARYSPDEMAEIFTPEQIATLDAGGKVITKGDPGLFRIEYVSGDALASAALFGA